MKDANRFEDGKLGDLFHGYGKKLSSEVLFEYLPFLPFYFIVQLYSESFAKNKE